jgi:hypothetical protein
MRTNKFPASNCAKYLQIHIEIPGIAFALLKVKDYQEGKKSVKYTIDPVNKRRTRQNANPV